MNAKHAKKIRKMIRKANRHDLQSAITEMQKCKLLKRIWIANSIIIKRKMVVR